MQSSQMSKSYIYIYIYIYKRCECRNQNCRVTGLSMPSFFILLTK